MGDGITYDYTIGIRAVTSINGMTSDFACLPLEVLQTTGYDRVGIIDYRSKYG